MGMCSYTQIIYTYIYTYCRYTCIHNVNIFTVYIFTYILYTYIMFTYIQSVQFCQTPLNRVAIFVFIKILIGFLGAPKKVTTEGKIYKLGYVTYKTGYITCMGIRQFYM